MEMNENKKLFVENFGEFLNAWNIAGVREIKYKSLDNGMEIVEIYYGDSDVARHCANITADSYAAAIKDIMGVL